MGGSAVLTPTTPRFPRRSGAPAPRGCAQNPRSPVQAGAARRHAARAEGSLARTAGDRRLGDPARPRRAVVPDVDRPQRAARGDARHSRRVSQYLIAVLWAVVGAGAG